MKVLKPMKTLLALTLMLTSVIPLSATTRKSAAGSAVHNISWRLEHYKQVNGRLPTSWQEFAQGEYFSGVIKQDAQRLLDVENRYAFVDLKPIRIGPEIVRIFFMAKQPGDEGNNFTTSNIDLVEGRWVIFENEKGEIVARKYTEKALKLWFAKARLNLADYTFDAPRSPSYNLGKEIGSYFRVRPWLKVSCFMVLLTGGVFLWRKFRSHRELAAD